MNCFEIQKQIGTGSFGVVLLARSISDDQHYVLKQLNLGKLRASDEAKREIEVLSSLAHVNIVRYCSSFEHDQFLYIVMDYCSGGDLYTKIQYQKTEGDESYFDHTLIWCWFVQSCMGLQHMHDRRILHRDLKSQNIFLTDQNTVKVGDFGISRVLDSTVDMARTVIGTPYYLSPEICENRPYNTKTDIWALGCLLYELIALKHPFTAGNMRSLLLKIVRASYPPLPRKFSGPLISLVDKMLKIKPQTRPSVIEILNRNSVREQIKRIISADLVEENVNLELNAILQNRSTEFLRDDIQTPLVHSHDSKKEVCLDTESEQIPVDPVHRPRNEPSNAVDCAFTNNPSVPNSETFTKPLPRLNLCNQEISAAGHNRRKWAVFRRIRDQPKSSDVGNSASSALSSAGICSQTVSFDENEDCKLIQRKSCKKCGKGVNFDEIIKSRRAQFEKCQRKTCRKCGLFQKFVEKDHLLKEDASARNEDDKISLFSKAETLRAELEARMGLEHFKMLYRVLIDEGKWLDPQTASVFNEQPDLCQKFRELLLAECAYDTEKVSHEHEEHS